MRRPGGLRAVAGQPIATLAVMAAGGYSLYLWFTTGAVFLGLAALWVMGWTLKANSRVAEYKAWKRAWDAMEPSCRRRLSDHPLIRIGALVVIATGTGVYLHGNQDQAGFRFALAWLAGGLALIGAVALLGLIRHAWRSGFRRRARSVPKAKAVRICISRAVVAVPSLERAYSQLPEHCWRVLATRSG